MRNDVHLGFENGYHRLRMPNALTELNILYVSDGKAGHRAQALGLLKATQLHKPNARLHEVLITDVPLWPLFVQVFVLMLMHLLMHLLTVQRHSQKNHLQNSKIRALANLHPDWIVGVGSHSHLRVWLLQRCFPHSQSMILMKPSLPLRCFDAVIAPQHDGLKPSKRVLCTQGVLNPLQDEQRHQTGRILIAIGGSSKRHKFDSKMVLAQIQHIIMNHPQAQIVLTTSRRTPVDFLTQLHAQVSAVQLAVYPVEQTPQGWIFEQMQLVEAFWVTEDSVSMLYEGLSAGCRVGVLAVTRLKQDRVTRGVDELLQQQAIGSSLKIFDLPEAKALNEAKRVAIWLLEKSVDG